MPGTILSLNCLVVGLALRLFLFSSQMLKIRLVYKGCRTKVQYIFRTGEFYSSLQRKFKTTKYASLLCAESLGQCSLLWYWRALKSTGCWFPSWNTLLVQLTCSLPGLINEFDEESYKTGLYTCPPGRGLGFPALGFPEMFLQQDAGHGLGLQPSVYNEPDLAKEGLII